ncbi:polyamine ABC transporter substrate-binding protein [Hypericibacter terrae]|uniref:Polyamine ABC transporter substrate-binding protein n=1 Tax=Hypericibacter terrae TaxID=2602015 RepID=A0A5J6MJ46_9PROT|nr:ABC transporter permease [Hypericibacter terrae]QEX17277.1 polyamine ABC transporter substrate-binding protein [Hypericibacter terrae]
MTAAALIESNRPGNELARRLRRAERTAKLRAFLLVLPLLLFVIVAFVLPIGQMLLRSIDNTAPCRLIPQTCRALQGWDGTGTPGEAVYASFAQELTQLFKAKTVDQLGTRFNYETSGMLSLVRSTARQLSKVTEGPYQPAFAAIDPLWADHATWAMIRQAVVPYTSAYYLNALDMKRDADGNIVAQPEDQRIYIAIFLRTFWIGLITTGICLLLGYPVAYLLAHVPTSLSNRLLILVLLPFWTSLLVRTTSWIVLLQSNGVVLDLLVHLGIVADNDRPTLIYNKVGTFVAMTHVLLPFMILPLYSVMRTISPLYQRAAESLGAHPATAFLRVYLPLSLPGIGAGGLLVFILSVGYYITPALVGGQSGQLISNLIAYHMRTSLNWGLASALSAILLVAVLLLYWLYNRLVGLDNTKLG